ncbi:MAG: helix-turn-helix domain-containing protein [Acidobacteriota bacterium]
MKDEFLRVSDIMRLLKVSRISVNRYFQRGLVYHKVGGLVRVSRADLSAFLDARRVSRRGDKIIHVGRELAEEERAELERLKRFRTALGHQMALLAPPGPRGVDALRWWMELPLEQFKRVMAIQGEVTEGKVGKEPVTIENAVYLVYLAEPSIISFFTRKRDGQQFFYCRDCPDRETSPTMVSVKLVGSGTKATCKHCGTTWGVSRVNGALSILRWPLEEGSDGK